VVLSYGSTSRYQRKTRKTRREKEEKEKSGEANREAQCQYGTGKGNESRSTAIQELMLS
jgi:hypothetical protein